MEITGVTYSVSDYEHYNQNGDLNYFEEVIDAMILDGISGMNDTFRSAIRGLSRDKKRMTILSLLDKDLNLFKRIKALTDKNIGKMDHIKDIILMLREYVKVGEVEKKKFGEVMTPLELVKELYLNLPEEVWSNPNLKWLDSCNGTGPFLILIIYKLMNGLRGWEPNDERRYKHIVENMIYAGELQPKNMFLYMCAVDPFDKYKLNIYTGSFLEDGFDKHMKEVWNIDNFDIVVGNPPYQKGKNSNFYVEFIDKFFQVSKSGSYLLYVVPNRFFQPSHKAHKCIIDYDIKIVYHNVNEYFPGVSTHIGAFVLSNNKPRNLNQSVVCKFKDQISVIDFNTPVPTDINMSSMIYKNLLDKIINKDKISFSKTNGDLYIKRQWKRWNSVTEVGGDHVFNCVINYNEDVDGKDGRWITCSDTQKMEWYLSKSNIVRFITKLFASAMNVPPFVWTIIPAVDLNIISKNEDLYKFFNLTEDEIVIIEKTIR